MENATNSYITSESVTISNKEYVEGETSITSTDDVVESQTIDLLGSGDSLAMVNAKKSSEPQMNDTLNLAAPVDKQDNDVEATVFKEELISDSESSEIYFLPFEISIEELQEEFSKLSCVDNSTFEERIFPKTDVDDISHVEERHEDVCSESEDVPNSQEITTQVDEISCSEYPEKCFTLSDLSLENLQAVEHPNSFCSEKNTVEESISFKVASDVICQDENLQEAIGLITKDDLGEHIRPPKSVSQVQPFSDDSPDSTSSDDVVERIQESELPNSFCPETSTADGRSLLAVDPEERSKQDLYIVTKEGLNYHLSSVEIPTQNQDADQVDLPEAAQNDTIVYEVDDQSQEVKYHFSFNTDGTNVVKPTDQLDADSNQDNQDHPTVNNGIENTFNPDDDELVQDHLNEYYTEQNNTSDFWRRNDCFYSSASNDDYMQSTFNSFLTDAKYATNWSAVTDDEDPEKYMYSDPGYVTNQYGFSWQPNENASLQESQETDDSILDRDNLQTRDCDSSAEKEDRVRIRYTRAYLLQFSDCILAYAFPEGLRKFTATGELPLKQFESEPVERPRPQFMPTIISGMEHIMFYNDMHYISNMRRPLF